jgi:hypothetical protein
MAGPHVTADRLRECLTYNPDTGLFTRRIRTGHRVKVGDPLGGPTCGRQVAESASGWRSYPSTADKRTSATTKRQRTRTRRT